jgi:hypothetical protein
MAGADVTIALGIPHTPWLPARVASMARLSDDLDVGEADMFRKFSDREPNHVWSAKLWTWGLECGASHLLQLQDDVIVMPRFWEALRAMIAAVPDRVIGLEAAHPAGRRLARQGYRWYTTADMLIGVGYVFPRALLEHFLHWRSTALRDGWEQEISEDTLIGLWALATRQRIFHPIPTIIDHDTTIASSYGNDAHAYRNPSVTWKDCVDASRAWRSCLAEVPHLGRFYQRTPAMAARWIRDWTTERHEVARSDVWRGEVADCR